MKQIVSVWTDQTSLYKGELFWIGIDEESQEASLRGNVGNEISVRVHKKEDFLSPGLPVTSMTILTRV